MMWHNTISNELETTAQLVSELRSAGISVRRDISVATAANYNRVPAPDQPDFDATLQDCTWVAGAWEVSDKSAATLAAEQQFADWENILTPARFAYLLALTGLEDVWVEVANWAKVNSTSTYAMLRANQSSPQYRLGKTLTILAQLKEVTDVVAPEVDLSEPTIRAAWEEAKTASF